MALNRNSWWKVILLIVAILIGILYSLPNIFGEDYAVQINDAHGNVITDDTVTKIKSTLDSASIPYLSVEQNKYDVLVKLNDSSQQLNAQDLIRTALGDDFITALNLASASPKWLENIGAEPVKLGLDLRGGVYFLMQVDSESAIKRRLQGYLNDFRNKLMKDNLRYRSLKISDGTGIDISFPNQETLERAQTLLSKNLPEFIFSSDSEHDANTLQAHLSAGEVDTIRNYALEQSLTTLRNRVNELGVAEALVQRQGVDRIVVELPGIQDTARAKNIIGNTATIEFRLADPNHPYPLPKEQIEQISIPSGYSVFNMQDGQRAIILSDEIAISGDSIDGAVANVDSRTGKPAVQIRLGGNSSAIDRFIDLTAKSVGKPMATVYVETKFKDVLQNGKTTRVKNLQSKVINVATINEALNTSFVITGLTNMQDARNLALLLRSGALPAPIDIISERTIGPSLGKDNIRMGINSVIGGLALVLICMAIYYSIFGLIADLALMMNLIFLVAICSLIHVTMTLPGIAGIVLTLGMAVDANVLIFERIREELRQGTAVQSAIAAGFNKAFATIVDANITTLIAAIVLFAIGSGAIKGFAVTLTIGLITSMFTSIYCSRILINWMFGKRKIKNLPIGA